ncbi:SlyX family protein [Ectothiorhodospiraceae bacterium 2226]|nr:SlyX family protein [Ectothiorhodospiraceae bacterium 2226]
MDAQARIEELEIRSAHQERALEQLSEQVAAQQQRLDALEAQLERLRELLRAVAPSDIAPEAEERPPPHY